jgi:hypothetical protein
MLCNMKAEFINSAASTLFAFREWKHTKDLTQNEILQASLRKTVTA